MNRLAIALALYPGIREQSTYHTARSAWNVAYYRARMAERIPVVEFEIDGQHFTAQPLDIPQAPFYNIHLIMPGTVRMVHCKVALARFDEKR